MRAGSNAPWRVIYIARGERQAAAIEQTLRDAGFPVDRRRLDPNDSRDEDIEIRVLDSEAEEARLMLMEHGL